MRNRRKEFEVKQKDRMSQHPWMNPSCGLLLDHLGLRPPPPPRVENSEPMIDT